jgi:glutamine synthetase
LIENVSGLKNIFGADFEKIAKRANHFDKDISKHIEGINSKVLEMTNERKANVLTDGQEMAEAYCDKVKPYFEVIVNCDKEL